MTEQNKKPDGIWFRLRRVAQNLYRHTETEIYYGRRKLGGKINLHCFETTDFKVAKGKLAEWLSEGERIDPTTCNNTLDELLENFKTTRSYCQKSTQTVEAAYIQFFRLHFDCTRRVSSLRPSELQMFVKKLADKRNYSSNSHNRLCLFVRQLFEVARIDGMTAQNLYVQSGLRNQRVHRTPPSIPTDEQFEAILAEVRAMKKNARSESSADFLEFQGRAGLGQAEASGLCWADIDFNAGPSTAENGPPLGQMRVRRVKTGVHFLVPIYPKLRPLLLRLKNEAIAQCKEQGRPFSPKDRVFVIDNARNSLVHACERLKLPVFSQRNLRQMCIVALYRAGVDIKTIAEWQGHRDGGKMIMDTYTQVLGADKLKYAGMQLAKLL